MKYHSLALSIPEETHMWIKRREPEQKDIWGYDGSGKDVCTRVHMPAHAHSLMHVLIPTPILGKDNTWSSFIYS